MPKSLSGFRTALLIGWVVLAAAGVLYARARGIPQWAALPVLAAFLIEYPFYLVPGFESAREWLAEAFPELPRGLLLGATATLPYLAYSIPTQQFHWLSFLRLAALAFTISLWYVVLPRTPWSNLLFLGLLAAVVLRKFFAAIYTPPVGALRIEVLGQLMLIHLAALTAVFHLGAGARGFGFLPNRREWAVGLRYFLLFLPVGLPLAIWIHLIRPVPAEFIWWKAVGTFFGILWVVALSEELAFRGLLQVWLSEALGSPTAGLILASGLFGLCHLGFRSFPNWPVVFVFAIAGVFYGRAFQRANSVRAGMVTHALVVTVWRTIFS